MAAAKRKTPKQLEAERAADATAQVVQWSVAYGAPIAILEGWDPDTGTWAASSPVGIMLAAVQQKGMHVTTAAQLADVRGIGNLMAKGNEFLAEAPEDRTFIPIGSRVFVDLVRGIEQAEALLEFAWLDVVQREAKQDGKLMLQLMSRRFGQRWREQQAIFTAQEHDERDGAITRVISNPDDALAMAELAHKVEDQVQHADPRD